MSAEAKMILPLSEDELQAAIIEMAETLGWLVYHTRDSRGSAEGSRISCSSVSRGSCSSSSKASG